MAIYIEKIIYQLVLSTMKTIKSRQKNLWLMEIGHPIMNEILSNLKMVKYLLKRKLILTEMLNLKKIWSRMKNTILSVS